MKPFENIKVLDLTHVIAGPFCTYQLAMLGADVIKVESPSAPDMMRSSGPDFDLADNNMGIHYQSQSAGKKSLALDFKHPEGRVVLERLIQRADVLVENFRGDVMRNMQLGYAQLRELNAQLIYCSMSGFGHSGPKAEHPAYDNVIQAYSGLMAASGSAETGPVKIGPPVLDYGTGAQAALAISAALFQRQTTGQGQYIDVAMLDAALMLMSSSVTETLHSGSCPSLPGNSNPSNAGYGVYTAKKGELMLGAHTPKQLSDMWLVLQQPSIAEQVLQMSYRQIKQHAHEHRRLLTQLIAQQDAQQWEDQFNSHGVPAARVRQLDETLASEQVRSRKIVQQTSQHGASLKVPVAAFSYAEDGPSATLAPPILAQHTHEVLSDLGYSESEIDALVISGVILKA